MTSGDPFAERFDVPVEGGTLAVWRAGAAADGSAPIVLAAHGITANHTAWGPLVRALAGDDVSVLVPDLRGRGDSSEVAGPFGIRSHVADLAAVLDHVGASSAILTGHSMGGYVVSMFAKLHPDRVPALIVVDGGIAIEVAAGVSEEQAIQGLLGPSLARLDRTFSSRPDYYEFWQAHPALGGTGIADADLEAYADQDLGEDPAGFRPRLRAEAVRLDFTDLLLDAEVREAIQTLQQPVTLLRAPLGLLNEDNPFVKPTAAAAWADAAPRRRRLIEVTGTNHYSITLADRGAVAIAEAIRQHASQLAA